MLFFFFMAVAGEFFGAEAPGGSMGGPGGEMMPNHDVGGGIVPTGDNGLPSYDEALNHPQPTGAQGGEGIQELESYLQMEQNIGGAPQRPS